MADGQVRSAGEGDELGAGFNEAFDHQSATPIPVTMPYDYDWQSADHKVKDVYRGFNHTYILTDGGHVYGCGENAVGQLGIGNTTDQYTFVKITFPDSDVKIREIVLSFDDGCSGWTHYFVAEGHGSGSNDGRVYACGDNDSGQIGDGTLTDRTSPVRIGTLTGVEKLWAWGGAETAAFCRLSGGDFYAWGDVGDGSYGYYGVHAADGSTAANVQSPIKQGTDGFKPGDATAPYGLHGVDDMRVHRSHDGGSYYSSTFALLTSGHIYGVGYNDSSRQMGQGDATNDVTTFTLIPSVSAAYAFDTHAASTVSSAIATCSAIEGGSWNSTTMKYEGFTDQTSVSGVKLIGWGYNGQGELGDGTATVFPEPRIMNNYLPTALCASVSSVICEKHSRSNGGAMTYIRDLSGYYWFAGYNGYGLDTGNDLNQAAVPQVNTFKKISLPVHPSEIKDFQVAVTDFVTACSRTAAVILTHNGRVFVNGDLKYTFGIGYTESTTTDHARTNWYPVRF
jgi:alpha-tubulin suppressor-like RCC1 family protein